MTLLLSIFASDILPIFAIAGVGFVLARTLAANVRTLSHVVFYALVPCLVFNLLVTSGMTSAEFGRMALLNVLVVASMAVIARVIAVPLGLSRPEMSAFMLVVMISNAGNYGLPVVLFAFGPDALAHASAFFVTGSLLTYTVGVFVAASGRRSMQQALGGVLRVPAIYAVAAAALVLATGTRLPLAITRPISMLGDAAIPMMILVLGMQLERATLPERPAVVAAAVLVSLVIAPLVALSLTAALGVTGPARQAAVCLASTPVAVITTILSLEFDVAPAFVTSAVLVSTLLSPFTLTPLIAYLQSG
ncbi:MAG TPA: AEC family transporter [Candidatus Limnocylindrales bacterium]|nr:AEC family transporter [Candidatus Limnocylindrales bacterium]